jgi:hypothetical protein
MTLVQKNRQATPRRQRFEQFNNARKCNQQCTAE